MPIRTDPEQTEREAREQTRRLRERMPEPPRPRAPTPDAGSPPLRTTPVSTPPPPRAPAVPTPQPLPEEPGTAARRQERELRESVRSQQEASRQARLEKRRELFGQRKAEELEDEQRAWATLLQGQFGQWSAEMLPVMTAHAESQNWNLRKAPLSDDVLSGIPYFIDPSGALRFSAKHTSRFDELGLEGDNPTVAAVFAKIRDKAMAGELDPLEFFLNSGRTLGLYQTDPEKKDEFGYPSVLEESIRADLTPDSLEWGAWMDEFLTGSGRTVGYLGPLEGHPAAGAIILASYILPWTKGVTALRAAQGIVRAGTAIDVVGHLAEGEGLSETSTAKSIGAFRNWEKENITRPAIEGMAKRLDVPIIDIPESIKELAEEALAPSFLALGVRSALLTPGVGALAGHMATRAAGPTAGGVAALAARGAVEGAILLPADVTLQAWSEGRDPNAEELLLALGMGIGGGAALGGAVAAGGLLTGAALPFVAKAVGGTLIKTPAGRYLLRVTGRQYRNASQVARALVLGYNLVPAKSAKLLPQMVKNLPMKTQAVLGIGPKTKFYVHVTPDTQIRSIADNNLKPSTTKPDQILELNGGAYGFAVDDSFDTGWKVYGGLVQRTTEGADPSGVILATRADTRLLNAQSDEYTALVRKNRRPDNTTNWQGVDRDVVAAGYHGVENVAQFGKAKFGSVTFLDDSAYDIVGQVVPDLQRATERAPQVMGRKVITQTNLREMSFDELAAEFLTGGGGWLPPSAFQNWTDFFRKLAGIKASPRVVLKSGQVARYARDYSELLADPRIARVVNSIPDAVDRDQYLHWLSEDWITGPIPKGVGKMKWLQAAVARAPGVRRSTQWLEVFTGRFFEEGNISINRKATTLTHMLRKAFPREVLENPEMAVPGVTYIGPARRGFQAEVTGRMADIIENPQLYRGVTPEIQRLAEVYTQVQNADALLMRRYGVEQETITGLYVSHKATDASKPAVQAAVSSLFRRGGRPIGRRLHPSLAEYHDVLRAHGLTSEADPLALFISRMSKGNQARAQAVYAQSVAKHHGGRILGSQDRLHFDENLLPAELTGGQRIAVPTDVANEVAEAGMARLLTPDVQTLEKSIDFFRGVLLSADLSFFTIQGFALFATDPARYLRNIGEMAAATSTREGFMLWTAAHSRELAMASRAGLKLYSSAIDLPVSGSPPALKLLIKGKFKEAASAFWDSPVQHLPVISVLNDVSFGRLLPIAKMYNFRANYEILRAIREEPLLARATGISALKGAPVIGKRMGQVERMFRDIPLVDKTLRKWGGVHGKTDFELMQAAADMSNNLGGGIDRFAVGKRTDLLEKTFLLTPSWIRANVGRLVLAPKVFDPRGVLARRALMHQLTIAGVIATAGSLAASGRPPSFDPRQSDWLDIQTEEGSLAIMPGKTYLRTLARLGGGVPWRSEKPWELTPEQIVARFEIAKRFGEGRVGQMPRLATDLYTGRDFLGRKIDSRLLYAIQSLSPIVVGEFMEAWQEGARGKELANRLWPEFLGMNAIPIRPQDRRNKLVAEAAKWRKSGEAFTGTDLQTGETIYLTEYGQLSRAQKDEFDTWDASSEGAHINSELDEELERRSSPFVVPDAIRLREQDDIRRLGEQFRANWPQNGSGSLYRDGYAEIRGASRAQLDFFFQQQGEPPEPRTLRQRTYQGYYEEVVDRAIDPINRQMDTDTFESLENAYFQFVRDEYGSRALAELKADLNIYPTDDAVARQWRQDREILEGGVWRLTDSLFTPEYLEEFGGFTQEQARNIVRENHSWEEFTRNWTSELLGQIVGLPMPPALGELTSLVDLGDGRGRTEHTWYEIFRVRSDESLSPQTAREVAKDAATKVFADFDTFRSEVRTGYLEEHTEEICVLGMWEYWGSFNARLSQYLQLCPYNPVPRN